jgi:hypothetical protein
VTVTGGSRYTGGELSGHSLTDKPSASTHTHQPSCQNIATFTHSLVNMYGDQGY